MIYIYMGIIRLIEYCLTKIYYKILLHNNTTAYIEMLCQNFMIQNVFKAEFFAI